MHIYITVYLQWMREYLQRSRVYLQKDAMNIWLTGIKYSMPNKYCSVSKHTHKDTKADKGSQMKCNPKIFISFHISGLHFSSNSIYPPYLPPPLWTICSEISINIKFLAAYYRCNNYVDSKDWFCVIACAPHQRHSHLNCLITQGST